MTRASLLHILNHVGNISEAEIRELEQLAAAFPYCQTAHVLLAKSAHDRGSMLASQRLRRAATYAADRQLLRQLLEQPAPETTTVELSAPKELPAPAEASLPSSASGAGGSTAFFQSLVIEDVQPLEPQEEEATTAVEEIALATPEVSAPDEALVPEASASLAPADAELEADAQEVTEPAQLATEEVETEQVEVQPEAPASQEAAAPLAATALAEEDAEEPQPTVATPPDPLTETEETEENEVADIETTATLPAIEVSHEAAQPDDEAEAAPTVASESDAEAEEVLPAVAPIRPPVEVGSSRFEFGLSAPDKLPVPILYQLPGLDEDDSDVEAGEDYALPAPAPTTALAPPFRADADLAYGLLDGGSRYGYALQLRDEELTLPLPATEFFPPDALLHAHTNSSITPHSAPAPSSFDLINRFLKVQPRLKAPVVLPSVSEQTDLAARSTHAPPALASESLAKIMVKQGKIDRAIEIYEQLMVRQPEKSAYFADQIQQLKTTD